MGNKRSEIVKMGPASLVDSEKSFLNFLAS
jgi:hypothetical protein